MSVQYPWIQCPWCHTTLDIPPEAHGKKALCPSCNREVHVALDGSKAYTPYQWWQLYGKNEEAERLRHQKVQRANERKIRRAERRRRMKKRIGEFFSWLYQRRKKVTITLAVLAVFVLLAMRFRYSITNAGNGMVYKTDNITGKTWLIYKAKKIEIKDETP